MNFSLKNRKRKRNKNKVWCEFCQAMHCSYFNNFPMHKLMRRIKLVASIQVHNLLQYLSMPLPFATHCHANSPGFLKLGRKSLLTIHVILPMPSILFEENDIVQYKITLVSISHPTLMGVIKWYHVSFTRIWQCFHQKKKTENVPNAIGKNCMHIWTELPRFSHVFHFS